MFCPACGDIRGNVELLKDGKKQKKYRCPVCGHIFIYISCKHLEKKYGPGTENHYIDDIPTGRRV